jgi:hypothetical protein
MSGAALPLLIAAPYFGHNEHVTTANMIEIEKIADRNI